jgi:hypothetical protein
MIKLSLRIDRQMLIDNVDKIDFLNQWFNERQHAKGCGLEIRLLSIPCCIVHLGKHGRSGKMRKSSFLTRAKVAENKFNRVGNAPRGHVRAAR